VQRIIIACAFTFAACSEPEEGLQTSTNADAGEDLGSREVPDITSGAPDTGESDDAGMDMGMSDRFVPPVTLIEESGSFLVEITEVEAASPRIEQAAQPAIGRRFTLGFERNVPPLGVAIYGPTPYPKLNETGDEAFRRGELEIFQPGGGDVWEPVDCFSFGGRDPLTLRLERTMGLRLDTMEFGDSDTSDGLSIEDDTFTANGFYLSGAISGPVSVRGRLLPDQTPPQRSFSFRPRGPDPDQDPLLLPWDAVDVLSDEVIDRDAVGRFTGRSNEGEPVALQALPYFALGAGCGFLPTAFHQLDYGISLEDGAWWPPGTLEVVEMEGGRDLNGNRSEPLAPISGTVLELPEPGETLRFGGLTSPEDPQCPECLELPEGRWIGELRTFRSVDPIARVQIELQAFSSSCESPSSLDLVAEGRYGPSEPGLQQLIGRLTLTPDEEGCSTPVIELETRQIDGGAGVLGNELSLVVEAKAFNLPDARIDILDVRPTTE